MRRMPFVAVLLVAVACTAESPSVSEHAEPVVVEGDGYLGVIFPGSSGREHYPNEDGYWTPSPVDITEVESALKEVLPLALRNPWEIAKPHPAHVDPSWQPTNPSPPNPHMTAAIEYLLSHLPTYRRQYTGIVISGHKFILVNLFDPTHHDFHYWRERWARLIDGGYQNYMILYEVDTGEFYEFFPGT